MAAQKLKTYGLETRFPIPANATQLDMELCAFARGGTDDIGGVSKLDHCKNITCMIYPWIWQYWNDWLEMIAWAWCTDQYDEVTSTGCAAAGKTFGFSYMAWLEWCSAPSQTLLLMSSVTIPSLRSRIWARVKDFYRKATLNGKPIIWPYNMVDSKQAIQFTKGDDEHAIIGVAVDSGNLEKALGKIVGRHPGRVVMLVDEGEQTPEAIFAAMGNLRSGAKFFKFASMANAISYFSPYAKCIEPKNGWNTVNVEDETWITKNGICLHFDGLKAPNVRAGQIIIPNTITLADVESCIRRDGENSFTYWKDIRGFPAPSGVRDTVLDASTIFTGKAKDKPVWATTTQVIGAIDPAFTSGGDACIIRFANVGMLESGVYAMGLLPPIRVHLLDDGKIPIGYQIADAIEEQCRAHGCRRENFAGDATSAGPLFDIVSQRFGEVRRINFGSAPTDRAISSDDPTPANKKYANRVAEMWFRFARLVAQGAVRGLDDESATMFCSRQFKMRGERYALEGKADYKKRMATHSCDEADATSLLADLFAEMHGDVGESPNAVQWDTVADKFALSESYG